MQTWIQKAFAPVKRFTPGWFWQPVRAVVTAVATPVRFSVASGHFRSSLKRLAVDRHGHPVPWYTYPAIEFLKRRDYAGRHILEIGAGQSTLWWASVAQSVVAIEENADWMQRMAALVPDNVELQYAPREAGIRRVEEIMGDRAFDVIVIDGHLRNELIHPALRHLKPQGGLLFDNSNGWGVEDALRGHDVRRVDFFGHAPGVILAHCTSLIYKGDCFLLAPEIPI